MGLSLLDITPHQVSRDLRGYSVFFYGEPKSGKTTIATKFPKHLLFAFEKGYNAIPGAMAKPINSWGEFRKMLKELKEMASLRDKAIAENNKADIEKYGMYETIIIDTADIAYDYCEKYICSNAKRSDGGTGVDSVGDIPFGKGYTMVAKEFDECLRSIVQMDYGLVLISHAVDKSFKDEAGQEFNQIVPTLGNKPRNIVSRMADIIGYSRAVQDAEGNTVTKLFMRGTPRYIAGSRFKYTPDYIDFNYGSLVSAISDAIDKQMEEDGKEYFTDTANNLYKDTTIELDFDALMLEFKEVSDKLMKADAEDNKPKILQVIERYLGKGAKVGDATRDQVEAIDLIVSDLKDLI